MPFREDPVRIVIRPDPPALVFDPVRTFNVPVEPETAVPVLSVIDPEFPSEDDTPVATTTEPEEPADQEALIRRAPEVVGLTPDATRMLPLFEPECDVVPVLKVTMPDEPTLTAFAVRMTSKPELAEVPKPETTNTGPPAAVVAPESPAWIITLPPVAEPELPARTETAPAELNPPNPVASRRAPELPDVVSPVATTMGPEDPEPNTLPVVKDARPEVPVPTLPL